MNIIMRSTRMLTGLGLVAFVLSGCVGLQLKDAEKTVATGGPFDKALHARYLAMSQAEYAEFDHIDSDVFAVRSMAAGAGHPPAPERVEARRISPEHVGTLKNAYQELTAVLDVASVRVPKLAALAQSSFDCWMQEQEEGHQLDHIAACRSDFAFAMGALKAAMAPKPKPVAKKAPPKPKPPKAYEKHVIYFPHDSATVDGSGVKAVNKAVLSIDAAAPRKVIVSGYTDRLGLRKYNMRLGVRRAKAVSALLQKNSSSDLGGIVETRSFGETHNAVETGDAVREPKNRRVKIDIIR